MNLSKSNSIVEEIKSSVKLSEIVKRYISIPNHSGKKFYIACPFHNEKSPSCVVQDDIGLFHCFGCGESGDLIKFVEKIDNINFIEACKKIANWFNIKYSLEKKSNNKDHDYSVQLNKWFQLKLKNNLVALEYLKNRGLSYETIDKFNIGWIPDIKLIQEFCLKSKIPIESLQNLGFKDSILKIFQNRIIFPIYNRGRICGFGARYISKRFGPKYINSPETKYFKKSEILYGMNHVDQSKAIILVEGYMDVIVMNQFKCNAVASLGTSVSYEHIRQICNMNQEAIICLDGDEAGLKSMKRLIELSLPNLNEQSIISFIILPKKEDPDSFLFKYGKEEWDKIQEKRIPLVQACWDLFLNKSEIPEVQYKYYKQVLDLGENIKNTYIKELYIKKWRALWKKDIVKYSNFKQKNKASLSHNITNLDSLYEKILIGTILKNPEIYDYICDDFLDLNLSKNMQIMQDLIPQWIKTEEKCLDFFAEKGFTDIVDSCLSDNVVQVAPFIFSEKCKENLVKTWHFIQNRYGEKSWKNL